ALDGDARPALLTGDEICEWFRVDERLGPPAERVRRDVLAAGEPDFSCPRSPPLYVALVVARAHPVADFAHRTERKRDALHRLAQGPLFTRPVDEPTVARPLLELLPVDRG